MVMCGINWQSKAKARERICMMREAEWCLVWSRFRLVGSLKGDKATDAVMSSRKSIQALDLTGRW